MEETTAAINSYEELSRRIASFSDLTTGDTADILEHLGMLVLDCNLTKDEYLNSYEYSGEMVRVKNSLIVKGRGFYRQADVQEIINAIM